MTTTESTLAKHCGECGKPLAEPGGQCAACGAYPDVSCMNRDALRSLLSDEGALASLLRGALAGTAIGMRAEAGMKHQEASQLLAEADRLEHGEAAQAAVTAAVELADAGDAKVDALEAAVGPAISAARGAEDRARKAAEHARVTAAEEAEASESGSGEPEELRPNELLNLRYAVTALTVMSGTTVQLVTFDKPHSVMSFTLGNTWPVMGSV